MTVERSGATDAAMRRETTFNAPSIALPKSGGAIRGIGEKFTANPATGTASMSIPIIASPGRSGFGPQLSLTYDSGRGNGPFGFGWSLPAAAVARRTDKGVPRYDGTDVFVLAGAEDLVPALAPTGPDGAWVPVVAIDPPYAAGYRIERYRPRIEGTFARIERWIRLADGDEHWRAVTRDNITSRYGVDSNSRIADPADPTRIFSWLLCRSEDGRGNVMAYEYLAESGDGVDPAQAHERHRSPLDRTANRYLKRIRYGNRVSSLIEPQPPDPGWMFELVFDYGDHDEQAPSPVPSRPAPCRVDPFSTYRSGFEVRTYRLCQRVLMFHHFPTEAEVGADCLVSSTDFGHTPGDTVGSFVTSVTRHGYRRAGGGYLKRAMPPIEFGYTPADLRPEVREVDPVSVANLPGGGAAAGHQWVDLDGEGIPGILRTGTDAWHYKANLGDGRLGPVQVVAGAPAPGLAGARLLDLAGDGNLDVASFTGPAPGFVERADGGGWLPWRPFAALPTVDFDDPDVRLVDLDGDGHADLLVAEGACLTWYPSLGEAGFGAGITLPVDLDADAGPQLVFADGTRSVYLADMSGDGLSDLVRVANGTVCYWPNLGHGRFGAKVTMDDAPRFDRDELFDQRNLRLVDVDGSGVTDLIYLAGDAVRVHLNRSGNGWASPVTLTGLPVADPAVTVDAVDFLGTGTACLVWSSTHGDDAGRPMRYADLLDGVKPHLLERMVNNLGAQTVVRYKPSTHFYLADRAAGRPWLTRLPFPVQVVERVETYDLVSGNRFVTRYAYHHGHFDGVDREFRGFGMVEQWDTEELSTLGEVDLATASNVDPASHVPPVLTRTWFHTGAFAGPDPYTAEYWREPGLTDAEHAALSAPGSSLPATLLLADGTRLPHRPVTEELREAYRALKGSPLREEVYAIDGSPEQALPYRVTESGVAVELLQPLSSQPHTVCLVRTQETVTYQYDRQLYDIEGADGTVARLADPRVTHQLTIDVDGYGNALRTAALAYGRRHPGADIDPRLPSWAATAITDTQAATLATVTVAGFTNAVDEPGGYRTPLPCESRTYELPNIAAQRLSTVDELRVLADAAPTGRLIGHTRLLYRRDDLAGPLPLGQAHSLGLPHEQYTLALTDGLIDAVYRSDLLPDAATVLADECGYLPGEALRTAGLFPAEDPDGHWWASSGQLRHSPGPVDDAATELAHARRHFFLPARYLDPFGNASTVTYDAHDLLIEQTRDPLDNLATATERDYRVLAPRVVTDANGNRGAVTFDARGLVAATALLGKATDPAGDSLTGFDPDLSDDDAAAYVADPLADPYPLIGNATTRLVHDVFAFLREGTAPAVAVLAREIHTADEPATGARSPIQHAISYSDGFGREIQRRTLAEPGPLTDDGPTVTPRWVSSGWTVFDNKGQPVRQYEPFFSGTARFEADARHGVSPIVRYDPAGRKVVTIRPDHTWQKLVFDPWRQEVWDASDTALIPDPAQDPDVGGHFGRLAAADYLPTWYAQRAGGALGASEQVAATKTAVHAGTPTVLHLDGLGRTFLTVAHNRPVETLHATWLVLDVEGNKRAVVDASGRTVARYDHDLRGGVVATHSMDAGVRRLLADGAGAVVRSWDERGHTFRLTYDTARRVVGRYVRGTDAERSDPQVLDREVQIERLVYGEGQPGDVEANLRTRAYRHHDGAGIATVEAYDFKGNPARRSRQFTVDYTQAPDWSGPVDLEPEVFVTTHTYDAMNRRTTTTAPDGSVVRTGYNEASLPERVDARLGGESVWTAFLDGVDYDAKGRPTRLVRGNGTHTEHGYDPVTLRLRTLVSSNSLQQLAYTYDPSGNITEIRDDAQQPVFFRNQRVEAVREYTYDALYQLVEATGREQLGDDGTPIPYGPADVRDSTALGRYVESYVYDHTGNILEMRHRGTDPANPGWTRRYTYANNRLTATVVGSGPDDTYDYDAHGCMTRMPHLSAMRWNFLDQLHTTARQVVTAGTPETTYHVYDAAGQRVRKVTESQAADGTTPRRIRERRYLGEFETFREYGADGSAVTLERQTLHVHSEDTVRVALVETRTVGDDGSPVRLIRYQLIDHLGSPVVELDETARVITHEEYSPYGHTTYSARDGSTMASAKRYRYTGRERDEESGLAVHGLRHYAPWLARWSSADPLGLADGVNAYRYARNNPVRHEDTGGTLTLLALLLTACGDPPAGESVPDPSSNQAAGATTVAPPSTSSPSPNSPPTGSPNAAPNAPPDSPMPQRPPPRPPTQPPVRPTAPVSSPTPPGGGRPVPPGVALPLTTGALVGGAVGMLVVGPAAALRQPCDPAKCGLDFTDPPTDEEIAFMSELYSSPVDRMLNMYGPQPAVDPSPVPGYYLGRRSDRKSRAATVIEAPTRRRGDNERLVYYRRLTDEDMAAYAEGRRMMPKGTSKSVVEHLQNKPTKHISASLSEEGARLMEGAGLIAVIDHETLLETGSTVIGYKELTNILEQTQMGGDVDDRFNAKRTVEVLIIGGIDPRAIVGMYE